MYVIVIDFTIDLDYGDVVYHRFDPEMHLKITKNLEQVHYTATGCDWCMEKYMKTEAL